MRNAMSLVRVLFSISCLAAALAASPGIADGGEQRAVPESGLVGHWLFDDCGGRTVKDRSHRHNDAMIEFGELRKEKGCTSLELDGLDGRVVIREQTPFGIVEAISVAIWVRVRDLRNSTVLFGIPHTTPSWTTPVFGMYASDRRAVYGMWLNQGKNKLLVETASELPLETWTHLAATYDGTVARLYVNGVRVNEQPGKGRLAFNGEALIIGRGLGSAKPALRGRVNDLRVYDHALTAEQVQSLFSHTSQAYDLARPDVDDTVIVETHASSPDGDRPWRQQSTRLLELLRGFRPARETPRVNAYGGWLERPRERSTGFFYTTKLGDRHWLIDPDGYRFFHVAMNAAREPRNVEATFGSADKWAEALTSQLRDNGFNGLGNWSSPRLNRVASPLVWVLRKDFMFAFARAKKLTEPAAGTQGFINRCMPVFHPEFEAFCDEYGKDLVATADDPRLLGIMTDNELQCPADLLDRYLSLDMSNADLRPNREAAAAWLEAQTGSADASRITQRDRYQFIAHAFERYYRIVTRAVRKYDPHHMYLGSRINYRNGQFDNPWFWKALAPYHDVVSVNYYHIWGQNEGEFADWESWAGRPVLLTEWYAKALDVPGLANRLGAGWLVRTQEDRARFYQHFTLGALETKNVVGWHWFKYLDDPAESQALDSAGGANKGMFNLEGRPYQPLLDRARAVNREVYPLIEFFDARNQAANRTE
jgi:hypothetical protein